MNPFEMVVLIMLIVMGASVFIKRAEIQSRTPKKALDDPESRQLREEVKALKERLHVLERIATDKENSLAREIDELRDR
jgi:hypothetical protein